MLPPLRYGGVGPEGLLSLFRWRGKINSEFCLFLKIRRETGEMVGLRPSEGCLFLKVVPVAAHDSVPPEVPVSVQV